MTMLTLDSGGRLIVGSVGNRGVVSKNDITPNFHINKTSMDVDQSLISRGLLVFL